MDIAEEYKESLRTAILAYIGLTFASITVATILVDKGYVLLSWLPDFVLYILEKAIPYLIRWGKWKILWKYFFAVEDLKDAIIAVIWWSGTYTLAKKWISVEITISAVLHVVLIAWMIYRLAESLSIYLSSDVS